MADEAWPAKLELVAGVPELVEGADAELLPSTPPDAWFALRPRSPLGDSAERPAFPPSLAESPSFAAPPDVAPLADAVPLPAGVVE